MPIIDSAERHLTFKLVYCGPPLAGKTTNLRVLYDLVDGANRGRLMTLEGDQDRTLLFDLLPIFFRVSGLSVRIKVYTVPGQLTHRMTRRAVLRGVDGVVFVADSRPDQGAANQHSFDELQTNLDVVGVTGPVPVVSQFNKQDVEGALEPSGFSSEPVLRAVAAGGEGVVETFICLAQAVWEVAELGSQLEKQFSVNSDEFRAQLATHLKKA